MTADTRARKKEPWHSVGVLAGKGACEAALALRGKRYLSRTEAPLLPLPDCTAQGECRCTYRHYADRRGGPRRAEDATGLRKPSPNAEQMAGRGRRDPDFG